MFDFRGCSGGLPVNVVVAGEGARVGGPRIKDGSRSVRSDHVAVEVHKPLSGNSPARRAHPVRGMASGTGEAVVDVPRVFTEAGIGNDLR